MHCWNYFAVSQTQLVEGKIAPAVIAFFGFCKIYQICKIESQLKSLIWLE